MLHAGPENTATTTTTTINTTTSNSSRSSCPNHRNRGGGNRRGPRVRLEHWKIRVHGKPKKERLPDSLRSNFPNAGVPVMKNADPKIWDQIPYGDGGFEVFFFFIRSSRSICCVLATVGVSLMCKSYQKDANKNGSTETSRRTCSFGMMRTGVGVSFFGEESSPYAWSFALGTNEVAPFFVVYEEKQIICFCFHSS